MKSYKQLKPTRSQIIAAAILTSSLGLSYAAVSIPHVFTAGTPASAADVNANFTALETAVNAGRVISNQHTTAASPIALSTTSNVQLMSLDLPGSTSGNAAITAHVYVEKNAATTGRYEFSVHKTDCAGTVLGIAMWRPLTAASGYDANTITLTAGIQDAAGATTVVLCGRLFDGITPAATVYYRGMIAAW